MTPALALIWHVRHTCVDERPASRSPERLSLPPAGGPTGGAVVVLAGAACQAERSDVVGIADGAAELHQGNVALCSGWNRPESVVPGKWSMLMVSVWIKKKQQQHTLLKSWFHV